MTTTRPETPADLTEFAWIWNRLLRQGTPAVHRRILRWLEHDEPPRRRLLMAFRGCGKSTLVGLYCAWKLYRNPAARILVLAADQALAGRMVAHVRRILERHPLCAALLPDKPDSWGADRFTVLRPGALREPSMLAQGLLGNITGSRADLIICDDVEVAGNCDTDWKREELRERLAEFEPPPQSAAYHTVGGLMLALLGRIPREGDRIAHSGWRFEVLDMDGRRVDKVLAVREEPAAPAPPAEAA